MIFKCVVYFWLWLCMLELGHMWLGLGFDVVDFLLHGFQISGYLNSSYMGAFLKEYVVFNVGPKRRFSSNRFLSNLCSPLTQNA